MGLLQTRTGPRREDSADDLERRFRMTAVGEPVDTISRHEPPNLFDRILPADPYGAWLEQREAERDREERPQIRWVYHRRGENGRGIAARRL